MSTAINIQPNIQVLAVETVDEIHDKLLLGPAFIEVVTTAGPKIAINASHITAFQEAD